MGYSSEKIFWSVHDFILWIKISQLLSLISEISMNLFVFEAGNVNSQHMLFQMTN